MQRIILFANGELPDLEKARTILRSDDFIICADGGTRHALALNVLPNLVIGDMDSVESHEWKRLEEENVPVELFPRDKNETDLELALNSALQLSPSEIIIMAALGGRIDQTLANITLLANLELSTFNIKLDDGVEQIFFCRDRAQVRGGSGDIVSLIPWGGPVHRVRTENLKWQLNAETLYPEKTRGISNEMTSETAFVTIESGLLLVIHDRRSQIETRPSKGSQ